MKISGLTLVICLMGSISSLPIKGATLCAAFNYGKLYLLPVVCYAALMLFALWKQNSKTASSTGSVSPLDDAPPAGNSNNLPSDVASSTGGNCSTDDGTSSTGNSCPIADNTSATGGNYSTDSGCPAADNLSSASSISSIKYLPSACIGIGCLLLLAYSLLYIALDRSRMLLLITGMLGISAGTLLNGLCRKNLHIRHHIIRLIIEAAIVAVCWISMNGSPK